jgi:EmrB/QacA subfamily drug resistance transporter
MRTPSTAASVADRGDTGAIRVGFVAIVLAMLPAVLDQTVLATALPTIATDLGRLEDVSWVVTAYVVSAAAATPIWGKLGDRHGRKRLLEASLASFLTASALCGIAQSLPMLIVSRAIQGAAAGGLMTLAYAAVGDLVSPRERGRYQGYIAATFAGAAAIGPLLGGLLVQHASWRWVFYVNMPVGLLALAGLRLRLPAAATQPPRAALDVTGAALLAAATAALMLVCIWGGQRYPWGSPEILALLAVLAISAPALVVRTRRAEDPIVPLGLLRSPVVALSSTALFLVTATMFSITVFVPLFLQTTAGATPTQAGLLLTPMLIGITLSTNLSGRMIERTGRYKLFPLTGLAMIAAAMVGLALGVEHPSLISTGLALALFGLGFGMVGQVLIIAVQNGVDRRELGVAMAVTSFFRALGGAVGAAILGAIFAARVGTAGTGTIAVGAAGRSAVIDAVHTVFLVTTPLALVALLAVSAIEEVPLAGTDEPRRTEPSTERPASRPATRSCSAARKAAARSRSSSTRCPPPLPGHRCTRTPSTRRSTSSTAN